MQEGWTFGDGSSSVHSLILPPRVESYSEPPFPLQENQLADEYVKHIQQALDILYEEVGVGSEHPVPWSCKQPCFLSHYCHVWRALVSI